MKDSNETIDIKENHLLELDERLLPILLKDNTTKKNILWCTTDYSRYGNSYFENEQIKAELIIGRKGNIIKPRVKKSKHFQQMRSKDRAEVFTPSWVCNAQNNLIDNAWFGRENVFNVEHEKSWTATTDCIDFSSTEKSWKDYVLANRLEISCGEAPYLCSRYDTVSGNVIAVPERIGLLDRKLRVVSENVADKTEWILWAENAVKSVYGYDWQGDNVLLARENILYSVIEHYEYNFGSKIDNDTLVGFANIISWNVWQMDGIKFVVPNSCHKTVTTQMSLFADEVQEEECEGCKHNNPREHNGKYCKIMDWQKLKSIRFIDVGGKK